MIPLALIGSVCVLAAFGLWWFGMPMAIVRGEPRDRPVHPTSPLELVLPYIDRPTSPDR